MLPRARRLRAAEVRVVMKEGRARRTAHLSMKYLPTQEPLRAAAVVSKSLAKNAVARNRLRRALYRALATRKESGRAVIFVQKMPNGTLSKVFSNDLAILFRQP